MSYSNKKEQTTDIHNSMDENTLRDFPGGAVVKTHAPNAGGPGSIPGQGTRSHMHAATKSSHATTKEPASRN